MSSEHIPERTCVLCRTKNEKSKLLRITKLTENDYVFDKEQKKQARAVYVCKSLNCLGKLSKHNKIKVSSEDLLLMLNIVNKESKNYLNILSSMKNSGELVFGINLIFENVEKVHFAIIARDVSKKNETKLIQKFKELNIPFKIIGTMEELGKIFNKDEVNVIGVTNKKMAKGLIN